MRCETTGRRCTRRRGRGGGGGGAGTEEVWEAALRAAEAGGDFLLLSFGGFSPAGPDPRVLAYDLAADRWTVMPAPLPRPRARLAAAHVPSASAVLLAGGVDPAGAPSAATDVYSYLTDSWAPGPDLPAPRSDAAAAAQPGTRRVFLAGGFDGAGPLADLLVIDLADPSRGGGISASDVPRVATAWQSACLEFS
eukprot:tig00020603_g11811.t1